MRKQEYKNYVASYLKRLSESGSLRISVLSAEAKTNHRLMDSLALYCLLFNKKDLFIRYVDSPYREEFFRLESEYTPSSLFDFTKIRNSYESRAKSKIYDDDTKAKVWKTIRSCLKEKGLSNYRVYKTLKLNPGNANAFLKNGDTSKLSLENIKRIYAFVVEA